MNIVKVRKLNNKGAALIIAIVVVAFVSILTTILLYLATMNFQMKSTDYRTKVSFYGAETPLEEFRTLLVVDVSDAATEAYNAVMVKFSSTSPDQRYSQYQSMFFAKMDEKWATRNTDPSEPTNTDNWIYGVGQNAFAEVSSNWSNYHVIAPTDWNVIKCTTDGCTASYHVILEDLGGADRLAVVTDDEGTTDPTDDTVHMELKGIKVIYTEGDFTSIITTDYCINVPNVNLGVDSYYNVALTDDQVDSKVHVREEINFEESVTYMNWLKQ